METMNEILGYMSAGSNDDNQVNPTKTVVVSSSNSSSSNVHGHGSSSSGGTSSSGTSSSSSSGRVKNVMNKKTTTSTGKNRNNNTNSSKNNTTDNSKMDVDDDNGGGTDEDGDDDDHDDNTHGNNVNKLIQHNNTSTKSGKIDLKRFDFIPLRLNEHERRLLHVLENALDVCEYTDVVDVTFSHTRKSKVSRIIDSLVDMLSIASGLIVSNNLSKGEQLLRNKSLNDNVPLFTEIFEIGRR
jgi:hypothetical protein